jgi:hypothetical protein
VADFLEIGLTQDPGEREAKLSFSAIKLRIQVAIMIYRHQPDSYPPSLYDDDDCLKPPYLLWLAALYLSRGVLLPLVAGLGHFARVETSAMTVMRGLWRTDQLIPAAFSAPVLYALVRRTPRASRVVRWVWRRGRTLLILSAAVDIVLALYAVRPYDELSNGLFAALATCAADAYIMLYVFTARRIRDAFAEFPQPVRPSEP